MSDNLIAKRNSWIDTIRGVSIIAVMLAHYGGAAYYSHKDVLWNAVLEYPARLGAWGVTMFFVISGFLICRTVLERETSIFAMSFRTFYVFRASRILPLFFLTYFVGILLYLFPVGPSEAYDFVIRNPEASFDWWFWASLPTFTFNWVRAYHWITTDLYGWGLHWDVMWSLAVEEQFYLFFPLLMWTCKSYRNVQVAAAALAIAAIVFRIFFIAQVGSIRPTMGFSTVSALDSFAIGILAAFISRKANLDGGYRTLLGLGGAFMALACVLIYKFSGSLVAAVFPTVLSFGVALFLLGALAAPAGKVFPLRIVAEFGRLSFGLYLFHGVSLLLCAGMLGHVNAFWGFGLYCLISFLLAEASFRWFEEPVGKAIRRRYASAAPLVARVADERC